jgi:hypothetical protein
MSRSKVFMLWTIVFALVGAVTLGTAPGAGAHDKWTFVWDQQPTGVGADLYGVDAFDAGHVWAVGTGGTILFYNGSNWSLQASGITTETLYEVSALDPNHVWAVGSHGTVLFYNGSSWSPQNSGTTRALYGVYAFGGGHVWAVGAAGTIRHFNGSAWQEQASGTSETLQSVGAVSASHVIAVGANTRLFYNGFNWASTGATTNDYNSVTVFDAVNTWASGTGGRISHYSGGIWTDQVNPVPAGVPINGITSTNEPGLHAWACTGDGSIVWGTTADPWTFGGDIYWDSLLDISAADAENVWTVGSGGAIFYGHKFEPPTTNRDWGTDSRGMTSAQTNWYLAEGCTAPGFVTYIQIANPQAGPANLNITFMGDGSVSVVPVFAVPAQSRVTLNVADYMDNEWGVSTRLHSDVGVVVERSMYSDTMTWGHNSIGVSSPQVTWYLAEGSTGPGFETWVLVQNAGATVANVSLTYMTPGGPVTGPVAAMQPNSRQTFNVADSIPGVWSVSTLVSSDHPVIAERAMYGNGRQWAHECVGLNVPSANWFLAEGCTGPDFETWVLVQNPADMPAHVALTYQTASGPVDGPTATLAPNTRQTFDVGQTVRTWDVSTRVLSDVPVVAERAMYGSGRKWAHDSFGISSAMSNWYLAEGSTGASLETWLLVQNPTVEVANVTFTFLTTVGRGPVVTVSVPPQSRRTFNAGDYIAHYDFGVRATSTRPIILERSMYGQCPT